MLNYKLSYHTQLSSDTFWNALKHACVCVSQAGELYYNVNILKTESNEAFYVFPQARYDFPGGSESKASVYNAGDLGSIPGLGRSPGEGNGNPLQDYCLENSMDRGAW